MCVLLILWCHLHHHLGENFQADHAALLSILRNEGVSTTGLGSKPSNNLVSQFWFVIIFLTVFLPFNNFSSLQCIVRNGLCILCCCSCLQPQRVSILKNKQKPGPTAGKHIIRKKQMVILPVSWWKQSHVLAHYISRISGFCSNSLSGLAFSPRFHKVRSIFSRPRCSSKHPAERGNKG